MESPSRDYDNAFMVMKGSLFAGGGRGGHCVICVYPQLEVKVIQMTGDILVID